MEEEGGRDEGRDGETEKKRKRLNWQFACNCAGAAERTETF